MALMRKLLIVPPIVVGAALLAYFVAQREPPATKPPSERARFVRVIEAAETAVVPRVLGFGTVSPEKVWDAVAQVSGEVVYVHPNFKKGAILPAGTEILRISPADYELEIAEAEANIRSSDAKLQELKVSEENTQLTLQIEQHTLKLLEVDLDRKQKLLKSGTASRSSVDETLRATLGQRQKVRELSNALRLLPTQRSVETEQKAVFQSQLALARLKLKRTRIRLPFEARLAEVDVEITQYAQVGQTLAVADSTEIAEVEAEVPISRFRMLAAALPDDAMGQGVTPETFALVAERLGFTAVVRLKIDDQAVEWQGRFARISDTIDPNTRTVGVIAAVDGPYTQAIPGKRPPLAKGMFVEVELRARTIEGRIIVPRSALHDGRLYLADKDNRLEIRTVETGLTQGGFADVVSGLKAGERVVVSDLSPAIPGMLLKIDVDKALSDRLLADAGGKGTLK
ncbi:MAG: efflux RND transporter periplasmic adaptor subunit [Hyphomicrobiales bacterium]